MNTILLLRIAVCRPKPQQNNSEQYSGKLNNSSIEDFAMLKINTLFGFSSATISFAAFYWCPLRTILKNIHTVLFDDRT